MKRFQLLFVVMIAGCSAPPATPPAQSATQAAEPASIPAAAATASTSTAAERAEALIADMREKEAAFAKLEKELPAVRPADLNPALPPPAVPSSPATPSTPAAPSLPYTPPSAPSVPSVSEVIYGGHNESWWRNEMRTIEARLESNLQRLKSAEKQVAIADQAAEGARTSTSDIFSRAESAYHEATRERARLGAAVDEDRAAIERLREDARRANVPPGWLR